MENTLCDLKDNYSLNLVLMTHLKDLERFLCRPVKFNLITVKFAERSFSFPIDTQSSCQLNSRDTFNVHFCPPLNHKSFYFPSRVLDSALVCSLEHLGVGLLGLLQPRGVEAAAGGEPDAAPPQA